MNPARDNATPRWLYGEQSLEAQLASARAKLRDIRAILNGPGPNGGWTRVDEDRQADLCDDLAERIGERP